MCLNLTFTPLTSISHILFILEPTPMIVVTLYVPRKGYKTFQCWKAMDQCGESYKNLFINVSQFFYLTMLKLQYVLLWTNTFQTFYHIFFTQRGIPMNYINTTFSLLITTLYSMFSMQWNMDFFKKTIPVKKSHFNVVLFSIDHSNRKIYVTNRLSPPQGENNQMVVCVFFSLKSSGHLITLFWKRRVSSLGKGKSNGHSILLNAQAREKKKKLKKKCRGKSRNHLILMFI